MSHALVGSHNTRDLRIDFFRGLALYVILIDHIGANPMGRYTFHRFGFSDVAEAFVFLSGLTCGMVYYGLLTQQGLRGLAAAVIRRSALIYAFYVLASLATIAIIGANRQAILNSSLLHDSFAAFTDLSSAAWSAVLLIQPLPLPSILVLYLALTLVAMPVFLLGARCNANLALAASGVLWLISQVYTFGPLWLRLFPHFNPLAWQFLFSIGVFIGMKRRLRDRQSESVQPVKWLLTAAVTIVAIGLVYRLLPFLVRQLHLEFGWIQPYDASLHKYNLSLLRIVHFLSVAYAVRCYVGTSSPILTWANGCLVESGKWSLQIFCLGAVLSEIGTVVFAVYEPPFLWKLVFNAGVVLFSALAALALRQYAMDGHHGFRAVCRLITRSLVAAFGSPPRSAR